MIVIRNISFNLPREPGKAIVHMVMLHFASQMRENNNQTLPEDIKIEAKREEGGG